MQKNKITRKFVTTNYNTEYGYMESFIPKKTRGTYRKVNAPNKALKYAQTAKLQTLNDVYYEMIKGTSVWNTAHGFIQNRNIMTCAELHYGYKSTIMMDIKDFFDSVERKHLEDKIELEDIYFTNDGYLGQGFPTSPILANIAIIDILKNIKAQLTDLLGDSFMFTIYADDIQLSSNIEDTETLRAIIEIIKIKFKEHDFEIKDSKTRIMYAKGGARRILGVNVWDENYTKKVTITRKMRLRMEKMEYFKSKNFPINKNVQRGLKEFAKLKKPNNLKNSYSLKKA